MSYNRKNGAISSDDPQAIAKLEEKLVGLTAEQDEMKKVNAYFRKRGSMKGYPGISDEKAAQFDAAIAKSYSWEQQPYPSYRLQNNNANIRRIEKRIKELKNRDAMFSKKPGGESGEDCGLQDNGWQFDGGSVAMNADLNRIQIFFDAKPGEDIRAELKRRGFKWAPSKNAWQRQLTANGIYAVKQIGCIQPKVGA